MFTYFVPLIDCYLNIMNRTLHKSQQADGFFANFKSGSTLYPAFKQCILEGRSGDLLDVWQLCQQ